MDKRARKALQGIKIYKPGKSIGEAQKQTRQRSVIKLASNENPFGMAPLAKQAIRKALSGLSRYPDATCGELRQKLAKKLRVPVESITVGNGSDEILVLAMKAFLEPGDEVLVAHPTFLIYEIQAQAHGAKVVRVPLKNYRYDLSAMAAAVTAQTKLVFIANPDNPSGTYVTIEELEAFLKKMPPQVLVVVDEAYYEFAAARDYPQSLAYIQSGKVLVTRSFSKAYGLAGLRVGYGVSHPEVIEALNAAREPFNVNTAAQVAAIAALDDKEFLKKTVSETTRGRKYLASELKRLGLKPIPSLTNFILVECGSNAGQIVNDLLEQGVVVRGMDVWNLQDCFRVSVGTESENRRFIKTLESVLKAKA